MNLDLFFEKSDLIPAIVQENATKDVLMLAYMNRASLEQTLKTGLCTFFSRSRQKLWTKGETSGNFQHLKEIRYDCDCDTLLLLVEADGPACHTGQRTCFYRELKEDSDVKRQ